MGFLKCPRSSWASKLDAHPLSFFLSFHTLIALVHPLHGNPYSSHWHQLMGISIARWLAASMWDFLLFCLIHTTPIVIFYSTHSDMSMAHAHVLRESWKSLRILKYETIAWLNPGLCMIGAFYVTKVEHSQTIWFCRDELSLAMLFWEDIIAWLVCLKYYYFYVNIKLLSWIFRIWIFMPQLRRITLKLCQVALHIKNSVFIIYLLEDEQELSLGMLDTSPTYL